MRSRLLLILRFCALASIRYRGLVGRLRSGRCGLPASRYDSLRCLWLIVAYRLVGTPVTVCGPNGPYLVGNRMCRECCCVECVWSACADRFVCARFGKYANTCFTRI